VSIVTKKLRVLIARDGPVSGEPLSGLAIELCVSRSVRDSAALLDAVAGADVGAPNVIAAPARPFLDESFLPPGRLKIAWSAKAINGVPVDPEVIVGLDKCVSLLESLGHELVEDAPVIDWPRYFDALVAIWASRRPSFSPPKPPLTKPTARRRCRLKHMTCCCHRPSLSRRSSSEYSIKIPRAWTARNGHAGSSNGARLRRCLISPDIQQCRYRCIGRRVACQLAYSSLGA